MIRNYLNQTASLKSRTGHNSYGEPEYAALVTIDVRWEGKRRLVRNQRGEQVVSEARVFADTQANPGDILVWQGSEWTVISAQPMSGLNGETTYWEVAV